MTFKNRYIRETISSDFDNIMEVETQAFGKDKEAKLTAGLLTDLSAKPILSLLAFHGDEAIGHILFTRGYIDELKKQPMIHILAPLAVKPEYQKQGIGGVLIKEGLRILKERGTEIVFVIGHMDYYPRHGFIPDAKSLGFRTPYPIPEEFDNAWMVQSLSSKGIEKLKGKVRCAYELNKEEHWRE